MSVFTIWKEKREERKKIAEQAGAILTLAHKEKRKLKPAETEEWQKRMTDVDAMEVECKQLERQHVLETELAAMPQDNRQAGRENTQTQQTSEEDRKKADQIERQIFRKYIAVGMGEMSPEERSIAQGKLVQIGANEKRALSDLTGTAGAYTVPQGFVYTLETALKYYGGIITDADYIDTTMGNAMPYPSMNDTQNLGEQLAENTQATLTTANTTPAQPTFGVVTFNAYMLDSGIIQIPIGLVQDSAFDLENLLKEQMVIRIGRRLNNLATVGSGSTTLTGVLTAASLGWTGASPTTISYNEMLDLEFSVDPSYRDPNKAKFEFADLTFKALRQLTDNNGRPLWIAGGVSEGIQNAAPARLDGFRYSINQDLPVLGSSNKSVMFGDFSKYKIRRVRDLAMVVFRERYMDALQIGLLAFQSYDGNLVDAGTHPVRYFQNSAT